MSQSDDLVRRLREALGLDDDDELEEAEWYEPDDEWACAQEEEEEEDPEEDAEPELIDYDVTLQLTMRVSAFTEEQAEAVALGLARRLDPNGKWTVDYVEETF